jgi:hypothetical protein
MPYVNDPFELTLEPTLEDKGMEFEEPRDYHEFFHDDRPAPGSYFASREYGIQTQVCRFDSSGDHVTMAKDCPHFNAEDEEGKVIRKGWTVQSNG